MENLGIPKYATPGEHEFKDGRLEDKWEKTIEAEGSMDVLDAIIGKSLGKEGFENARVLIYMGDGGQGGTYGTGWAVNLERKDLVKGVDSFVGVSAGATDVLYLLGGNAKKSPYMWMAAAAQPLMSIPRWLTGRGPLVDIPAIVERAEGKSDRPGDERFRFDGETAAKAPRGKFFGVATDAETGEPVYLDMTQTVNPDTGKIDPIHAAHGSANVPFADRWAIEVEVDGKKTKVTDGGGAGVGMKKLVETFKPTHILVIPAKTKNMPAPDPGQKVAEHALLKVFSIPQKIAKLFEGRNERFYAEMEMMRALSEDPEHGFKYLIAWPKDVVQEFNANPFAVKSELWKVKNAARDSIFACDALLESRKRAVSQRSAPEL